MLLAEVPTGGKVRVLSPTNNWRDCTVLGSDATRIQIHYDGYASQHDEWIDKTSTRLADACFTTGGKVRVLSPTNNWRDCTVLGSDATRIQIHYDGYASQHDEWIDKTSSRLDKMDAPPLAQPRVAAATKAEAARLAAAEQAQLSANAAATAKAHREAEAAAAAQQKAEERERQQREQQQDLESALEASRQEEKMAAEQAVAATNAQGDKAEAERLATQELVTELVREKFTMAEAEGAIHAVGLNKEAARSHITIARQRELEAEAAAKTAAEAAAAAELALQQRRRAAEHVLPEELVLRRIQIVGKKGPCTVSLFKKAFLGMGSSKHLVTYDDGSTDKLLLRRHGNKGALFVLLDAAPASAHAPPPRLQPHLATKAAARRQLSSARLTNSARQRSRWGCPRRQRTASPT